MEFQLSESEAERYDRQIRVWGAEAQGRIQNSRVLVCGMNKMNIEVVKNIVLAGVNITIQDANVVTPEDLAYNFFLTGADVGKEIAPTVIPKVKDLNSFACVDSVTTPLDDLPDEFFSQYSVVLMSGCSESQAARINSLSRSRHPQAVFFWSDVFGEDGLFYSDFGDAFQYKDDAQQGSSAGSSSSSTTAAAAPQPKQIKTIAFPSLNHILHKSWKALPSKLFPLSLTFVKHRVLTKFRDGAQRYPTSADFDAMRGIVSAFEREYEMSSETSVLGDEALQGLCDLAEATSVMTCSVLGSFLSQEVIKAVSLTGVPGYNVFVYSGTDFVAKAIPI